LCHSQHARWIELTSLDKLSPQLVASQPQPTTLLNRLKC
jgi:hypothetical protein